MLSLTFMDVLKHSKHSSTALPFPSLTTKYMNEETEKLGTDVLVIGHPGFSLGQGWLMINNNTLQEFNVPVWNSNTGIFTITANNIKAGCSGGPVFDEDRNLIGMVITISPFQAECIKVKEILEMITGLNYPNNKLQVPLVITPPPKGGGGGGIIINDYGKPAIEDNSKLYSNKQKAEAEAAKKRKEAEAAKKNKLSLIKAPQQVSPVNGKI